jgi:nitrate reductase assembly molybdenum cofactor insertion protein NarJ
MSTRTAADAHTTELLREAASWRVLGRLFECPDDHWRADLALLTRELKVEELSQLNAAIDDDATPSQYHSVFGPGGPAPAREASYHDSIELGSLMSDLAAYYHAFSYAPRNDEPFDHVAVEINFVSYLKFKEAYARAQGHDEQAGIVARAAAAFVTDHLARIATPLARLLAASSLHYLARGSALLAERVGPTPGPIRLPVLMPGTPDDEEDVTCGLR